MTLTNAFDVQVTQLAADVKYMLSCAEPQDIFDLLSKRVRAHGFEKLVLGETKLAEIQPLDEFLFLYHTGVDEYVQIYAERDYQYVDPVTLRAMRTHRPFRWREAYVDMTPTQVQKVKVAREYGLKFGYLFPIVDRPGPIGFVSMGRDTDFELDDLAFVEVDMLTRYAYHAIAKIHGASVKPRKIQLSPREVSVLLHVANGKTNWEAGQILGISEYSVRDYLKAISQRLETSNRTHTVVRAIQLGLILP